MDSETETVILWGQWAVWGVNSFVALVVLAFIIKMFLRKKEVKDAWNECDDPNVPDIRKYWCQKCKGHHGTYGGGENQSLKCKNCDSTDVYRVSPITLWQKFGYSLPALVFFTLGIVAQILDVKSEPPMTYIFYGIAVLCVFVVAYVCRTKLAVRNEWLIWAKERGYEENAEKI